MAGVENFSETCESCNNYKNVLIWNCVPLVTRHNSRTQPVSRHYWKSVIILLALLQLTEAYVTGKLNFFLLVSVTNYLDPDWVFLTTCSNVILSSFIYCSEKKNLQLMGGRFIFKKKLSGQALIFFLSIKFIRVCGKQLL